MKKILFIAFCLSSVLSGCAKNDGSIPEWPWYDESDPDVWVDASSKFGKLPSYIKVYASDSTTYMKGRKAVAYIATVDLTQASFKVWGLKDPTLEGSQDDLLTPTEVYNAQNSPTLVINGGYFYTDSDINYPASLAVNEGTLLSPNINYASQDWVVIYYPTRGAFVEHADGKIEVAWTYWADADNHFLYQQPAQNSYASDPLPQPSATFPEGGVAFEAKTAIGAGPVLLKNGEIVNSYTYEMYSPDSDVNVENPDPRSAIGITADKRLVLFVCEGREMSPGIVGFTTKEVAKILKSFGCTDALNLDGGGSSCLLINGVETIKPSDGQERSVGSCVYVK